MNNKYLIKDLSKINEVQKILLEIHIPKEEDFIYLNKIVNEIENSMFFIGNLDDIEIIATIKKVFIYIEKYPDQYFSFKYDLFNSFVNFELLYKNYLKNNDVSTFKENLKNDIFNLTLSLEELNKDKDYYYIKFNLNTEEPYFYLSRGNILRRLKEYGKAYNYIPLSLDDDKYNYFIVDFKVDRGINVEKLVAEILEEDDGIENYILNKIENNKNIYNIKLYFSTLNYEDYESIKKIFFGDTLLDIIQYENMLDVYVYGKNQLDIIKNIILIKNIKIDLILAKNIDNRETRVFAINGIHKDNLERVKKVVLSTLLDKKIVDILYDYKLDFFGRQFLEYLKINNNIENEMLSKF